MEDISLRPSLSLFLSLILSLLHTHTHTHKKTHTLDPQIAGIFLLGIMEIYLRQNTTKI